MSTEAYGLEPRYLLLLVVAQCVVQGSLIPMLATFLSSKSASKRPTTFKIYVILINALSFTQTVIAVLQGFDMMDTAPPRQTLVSVYMYLTGVICASVQAFFIHRCWIIFGKRVLPIIPFLVLLSASLVSGIMVVVCGSAVMGSKLVPNKDLALAVCVASSFILDLFTTTTTIVFLYRTRTGLSEHDSLFSAIWQVMWASAAPPLIVMSITLFNGYIIPGGPLPLTIFSSGINAKVFTLSLMISLLGQSHIRRRLAGSHPSQLPNVDSSRNTMGVISEPVFAPIMATTIEDYPSPPLNLVRAPTTDLSQDSLPSDFNKSRPGSSEVAFEKPKESEDSHAAQLVRFPREARSPHYPT
ncbi:unnamed protein product [Rhizoctonia solani]|uniref:Uncharacterized protein n=1 Tax=Rhizoctonia solani TaxID=456999 RepID=A0A8H2WXI7_9AGAM|nr:unnamed protein product [Rhizoctonia solani]